jgi:helix-turn-helix protein
VDKNAASLKTDDLIAHHLEILYENMLEANLLKIIHPYRYDIELTQGRAWREAMGRGER